LGGLEESATGILGELSKPLSSFLPAEKICEKLRKKDNQICDLRYGNFELICFLGSKICTTKIFFNFSISFMAEIASFHKQKGINF
jgi:hypothetical protein